MREYTNTRWIKNGWYWRFIAITVAVVAVLQVVAQYTTKSYHIMTSMPLAVLVVSYVIIPRVKERRLGNAIAGVIASFIVGIILELTVDQGMLYLRTQTMAFIYTNLLSLGLGLVMAYLYLRLTRWSERRRDVADAKRVQQQRQTASTMPVRHHSKKRRKR